MATQVGRLTPVCVCCLLFLSGPAQGASSREDIVIHAHGESTVAGAPAREIGFVSQIEYMLNQAAPADKLRIVNYGVGGIKSFRVLDNIRRTIAEGPDLLIVFSGHNEGSSGETDRKRYRANIQKMVGLARSKGIPLILCTVPYNMLWPPSYRPPDPLSEGYAPLLSRVVSLWRGGRHVEAIRILNGAVKKDGRDPTLEYLLGRIHQDDARHEEAARHYLRAKELDAMPVRVLAVCNQILRDAAQGKGVYLADVEAAFKKHSQDGIMGYELFADNCHPTPEGHHVIAKTVLDVILKNSLLSPYQPRSMTERDLAAFLEEADFLRKDSPCRKSYYYYLLNGTYHLSRYAPGGEHTDFKLDMAERFFQQALSMSGDDWTAWANLSTVSFLKGQPEAGMERLRRAVALHGKKIHADDKTPHLLQALSKSGIRRDEFLLPD